MTLDKDVVRCHSTLVGMLPKHGWGCHIQAYRRASTPQRILCFPRGPGATRTGPERILISPSARIVIAHIDGRDLDAWGSAERCAETGAARIYPERRGRSWRTHLIDDVRDAIRWLQTPRPADVRIPEDMAGRLRQQQMYLLAVSNLYNGPRGTLFQPHELATMGLIGTLRDGDRTRVCANGREEEGGYTAVQRGDRFVHVPSTDTAPPGGTLWDLVDAGLVTDPIITDRWGFTASMTVCMVPDPK